MMSVQIRNSHWMVAFLAIAAWAGCDNAPSVPKNVLPPGHEGKLMLMPRRDRITAISSSLATTRSITRN